MQRKPHSSFFNRKWRAVKQRAENASAMRPHTMISACNPAGRSASSRASALTCISSGATKRVAPRAASHSSVPPW